MPPLDPPPRPRSSAPPHPLDLYLKYPPKYREGAGLKSARSQQARGCWKEGLPGGCRAYRMRSDAFRPRAGSMQPSGALSKIGERALPHPSGLSRSMILLLCRNVPQTITAFRRSNKPAVRRKRHTTSSRLQQPGHHRQIRLSSVTS